MKIIFMFLNVRIVAFLLCSMWSKFVNKVSEVGINGPSQGQPLLLLCRPARYFSSRVHYVCVDQVEKASLIFQLCLQMKYG